MKVLFCVWMILMLFVPPGIAEKQMRLTFVGDVTLGSEEYLREKDFSLVSFAERKGYAYFFENVRGLFAMDDLTIVNLEGVLSDSNEGENREKTYRFRGEPGYTEILKSGSVEMVNLANNHTFDYGEHGYLDTKAALDESAILHFGGRETIVFEKNGIRIGFLAMSYTDESRAEKEWIKEEIRRLKKEENANAVVFCYHGGREYSEARTQKQVDIAKLAVNAGADLVIMHHPHVVQGMSIFNNRSVCYSLGNFCFGGNKNVRAIESLVVAATPSFSDDGKYLGQQIDLYPAHISGTQPRTNYQPLLVTGRDAKRVMRLVQADTRYDLNDFDEAIGFARQEYLPAEQ